MDPKLLYWTAACVNMGVVVAAAVTGVRAIRRGNVSLHRRSMLTASALVVGFVVSYALKLALLGREDLPRWSPGAVTVLRIHELCVFTMLLGGAFAGARAWRMRRDPLARGEVPRGAPGARWLAHRRAGWTAVTGAVLGVITAAVVLAGMYQRAAGH
jgi:uncharacterized membrane protein YozB (DUF420 family)